MITPDNNAPFNDNEDLEADDQRSQQDVQSDGFDDVAPTEEQKSAAEIDILSQADRASEASFTLDVDKGIAPKKD